MELGIKLVTVYMINIFSEQKTGFIYITLVIDFNISMISYFWFCNYSRSHVSLHTVRQLNLPKISVLLQL